MPATCLQMLPAVGAWVQVRFESIWVECEVIDVKNSWGKARLWVKPVAGEGLQWVEMNRVRHVATREAGTPPQPAAEYRTLHHQAT